MVRGSLDFVSHRHVAGWVFSPEVSLADRRVMAFVGSQCIGAGEVSVHRSDLQEAGLGDGKAGFAFPITIPSSAAPEDVYVKLERCALILPQKAWVVPLAS